MCCIAQKNVLYSVCLRCTLKHNIYVLYFQSRALARPGTLHTARRQVKNIHSQKIKKYKQLNVYLCLELDKKVFRTLSLSLYFKHHFRGYLHIADAFHKFVLNLFKQKFTRNYLNYKMHVQYIAAHGVNLHAIVFVACGDYLSSVTVVRFILYKTLQI